MTEVTSLTVSSSASSLTVAESAASVAAWVTMMSIARELGLDPLRVSRSYMSLVSSGEKKRR